MRTILGIGANDALFNLTVRDTSPGGGTEVFRNLTVVNSARRIDRVLENESNLARWDGTWDSSNLPQLPATANARYEVVGLANQVESISARPNGN